MSTEPEAQNEDLKPFKIGDMARAGQPVGGAPKSDADGTSDDGGVYTYIEGLFDGNDFDGVLASYDAAMAKLKPIATESSDGTKKRAAIHAIKAYDRAMELLTRMMQIRQEMAAG